MTFLGILKMFRTKRTSPEVEQARALSKSISSHADALHENLMVYQRAKDPFAAMMADLYNRDQLSRLHRGTSNGH